MRAIVSGRQVHPQYGVARPSMGLSGYLWDSDDEKVAKKLFGSSWPARSAVGWRASAPAVGNGRATVDIIVKTRSLWATQSNVEVGLAYWPDGPTIGMETVKAGTTAVFRGVPIHAGELAVVGGTSMLGMSVIENVKAVNTGTGQDEAGKTDETPWWVMPAVIGGIAVVGTVAVAYITGQVAPLLRAFKR